jgi:hypothetical protein
MGWRKYLEQMLADADPRSYTFDQAATVLHQLGFVMAKPSGGSHRRFRLQIVDQGPPITKRTVIIGLVDSGKGALKPVYIKEMVRELRENHLLPDGVE